MRTAKKLLATNFFYIVISLFNASTSIILIPLYLNNFSVSQYGVFALLNSLFSFITIFITLNLSSAAQTYYFDFDHDKILIKEYFKNVFSVAIIFSTICAIILISLGPYLFGITFKTDSILFYPYGLIIVLSALFSSFNQIYYVLLRNNENLKSFGYFMLVTSLSNLFFQILLIHYLRFNITGALLGSLIPNLGIFIYILSTNNLIHTKINFEVIKGSLKYSLWFLPFLFIQWFLAKGDRLLVENFIGLQQVGIYALLMNVSMVISLLATSILNSIRPSLFTEFKKQLTKPSRRLLVLVSYYVLMILVASIVVYALVRNIDVLEIAKSYIKIKDYIFPALTLFAIRVIIRLFNEYIYYKKKSSDLTLFSFFNLSVFIILFFLSKDNLSLILLLQILIVSNLSLLAGVVIRCFYLFNNRINAQHS